MEIEDSNHDSSSIAEVKNSRLVVTNPDANIWFMIIVLQLALITGLLIGVM